MTTNVLRYKLNDFFSVISMGQTLECAIFHNDIVFINFNILYWHAYKSIVCLN